MSADPSTLTKCLYIGNILWHSYANEFPMSTDLSDIQRHDTVLPMYFWRIDPCNIVQHMLIYIVKMLRCWQTLVQWKYVGTFPIIWNYAGICYTTLAGSIFIGNDLYIGKSLHVQICCQTWIYWNYICTTPNTLEICRTLARLYNGLK